MKLLLLLQNIILDKTLLSDLKYLTNFSHTGSLEVYYSSYNKWLPKSTHFLTRGGLPVVSWLLLTLIYVVSNPSRNQIRGKTFQCNIFKNN